MKTNNMNRREFLASSALAAMFAACNSGCAFYGVSASKRKFAINAATLRQYKLSFLEQVRVVAASGFKGYEPWMKDVHAAIADGTFDEAKRIADDSGLEFVNGIAFGRWVDPDPTIRAQGLAETRKDMLALKRLGCKRIAASMFGVQKPGSPSIPLADIAQRYRAVLALGEEIGVAPLLEYWGHSVNMSTIEEAMEVLRLAGKADGAILADVYHTYRGGSSFGSFAKLKSEQLPVLHVNDYTFAKPRNTLVDADRVWPSDGSAPWAAIFRMLNESGAEPWLSIELFLNTGVHALSVDGGRARSPSAPDDLLTSGYKKLEAVEKKPPLQLGVQMWSIADLWKKNPADAFARLRKLGYTGVQSFGFYDMNWDELERMLNGEGLKIVDMPFYLKTVATDKDFKRFVEFCHRFKIDFVFEPWFDGKATEAQWRDNVRDLLALKPRFEAEGLRMGFHNHQVEIRNKFANGKCPLDYLEEAGIDFELDVGHAKLAGGDPVKWLKRLAGRVPSIHAKPAGGFSIGGKGDANDWSAILPEASASGAKWAIVECEERRNTYEDVIASAAFLRRFI